MNYYKRYLGDYARDTAHLSLMEHGAYTVLLDTYYATGRPLPSGRAGLYRIATAFTAAERKAVDVVADRFFPVNGDGTRHNKRADEEITGYNTQAETNRRIAVEREEKRKGHEPTTNRSTNDQPNHSHSQKKPNTLARTEFGRFWAAYPKKVAKGRAEKAFAKLKPDEGLLELMLAAISSWSQSEKWRKESGRYIPHPATWLNDRGWEDELAAEVEPRFPI